MFGELDDSNIYESFDAFSDGNDDNSEFSFGDSGDTQGGFQDGDDFLDMSSYSERMGQEQPQAQNQVPPQQDDYSTQQSYETSQDGNTEYEMPQSEDYQYSEEDVPVFDEQPLPQEQPQKKNASGVFFLLILLLLAAAAGGLFYYKKVMAPQAPSEQAAGDYFYDRAAEQGAQNPQPGAGSDVATVDVDLSTPSQAEEQPAQAVDKLAQAQAAKDTKTAADAKEAQKPEGELTAYEKAEIKKKQDEQRNSQVGLSSTRVTIPVVAGGRVDPFVPYGQRIAASRAPKFDVIAPPVDIPSADPVVDEIVETKISGIMFDAARPSAIINISGVDQLVHKGDVVNGFSVLNITKNTVTLKYKSNIYQATVGEQVGEGVNLNPVSNLSRSFGGAYSKTPNNAIHF